MIKPRVIGIAGGSGSGKTTIARLVQKKCLPTDILLFQTDHYYRDLSHLDIEQRKEINFDHPDSIELDLVADHIRQLTAGKAIQRPTYEFASHTRSNQTVAIEPKSVIIVEGIFVLSHDGIRSCLDYGIYVDVDDDVRLIRRLKRDISERGRSVESVSEQYLKTVKPMFELFVAPSKKLADLVVYWDNTNERTIEIIKNLVIKPIIY